MAVEISSEDNRKSKDSKESKYFKETKDSKESKDIKESEDTNLQNKDINKSSEKEMSWRNLLVNALVTSVPTLVIGVTEAMKNHFADKEGKKKLRSEIKEMREDLAKVEKLFQEKENEKNTNQEQQFNSLYTHIEEMSKNMKHSTDKQDAKYREPAYFRSTLNVLIIIVTLMFCGIVYSVYLIMVESNKFENGINDIKKDMRVLEERQEDIRKEFDTLLKTKKAFISILVVLISICIFLIKRLFSKLKQ